MEHGHLHHGMDPSIGSGSSSDRFPQWSVQETRDFLMIRAELDQTFMETKRNKVLWEVISTKMKERGYNRSGEQCKAKWKNLVTRYKGCETMEHDGMRQQFPFYNDLQTIFTDRMQRMLWMESEDVATGSKKRAMQLSSDEEDENEETDLEKIMTSGIKHTKKKAKTGSIGNNLSGSVVSSIKDVLNEFMKQQMHIEMQWMKVFEAKEEERRLKELEWRQKMEALEKERMVMDQRWREREEQRMMIEEVRYEKRDALINALLDKFRK